MMHNEVRMGKKHEELYLDYKIFKCEIMSYSKYNCMPTITNIIYLNHPVQGK